MHAEIASVGPLQNCDHPSAYFHGPCFSNDDCRNLCIAESKDNFSGYCGDDNFFFRRKMSLPNEMPT